MRKRKLSGGYIKNEKDRRQTSIEIDKLKFELHNLREKKSLFFTIFFTILLLALPLYFDATIKTILTTYFGLILVLLTYQSIKEKSLENKLTRLYKK